MTTRRMVALKAAITPNCRQIHGALGAFDEAVLRARTEYKSIIESRHKEGKVDVPTFNLMLEVEYPA